MVRVDGRKIVFILVLFLGLAAFPQDKQADPVDKLREEILAVYQDKGEQGLRAFFNKNKNRISNTFIIDFAKAGVIKVKEEWLKVCKIMAEEEKSEKMSADVLFQWGVYFRITSNIKKAFEHFDKVLPIYQRLNDLSGQGNVYREKGFIYLDTSDNKNALEMFDKAMLFFEKTGDSINQGMIYNSIGSIHFYADDYAKALEMYDRSLQLFKENDYLKGIGLVYFQKGQIYFYSGDNRQAVEMYDTALAFFKKVGDSINLGNVYWRKGEIYFWGGDNSMALKMYEKALHFFRKMENQTGQGNVCKSKGDVYFYSGDNDKASKMYKKALNFLEKAGDILGQGNVYRSFGEIFLIKGDNSSAETMFDKALYFYEKAGSHLNRGYIYLNKGTIYLNTGNNAKALKMYDKALLLFETAGEPIGQGHVHQQKGELFFKVGDMSSAQIMFNKALVLFENSGFPAGPGNIYTRLGDINFLNGDNKQALDMYDTAQQFFMKVDDNLGLGNVYMLKGSLYANTTDNSKALEMYEKALPFFEKTDSLFGQGNVYLNMGKFYFMNGNSSKAVDMYAKAIEIYKKIGDTESESFTLFSKANIVAQKGKKNEALSLYEKALFNLERVRTQTAVSEMKGSFMKKVYDQYEETVLFMLENKFYEKGFKYAESMRARVFLDRMAEGLVPLDKGLNPELKAERDNLVGKLSALSRLLQETPGNEEKKLQELKEDYRRTESLFDDLLIKIRLENPLFASVHYPQPVSVRDLQKDVLKKDESLLSFFITPEKAYAFIVSRDNFKVKPLPTNQKDIDGCAHRFLLALKENKPNDMKRFGSLLYDKLLKPLDKYLKKSRDIIIVPYGPLESIPFESLIVSKNNPEHPVYLLEKYRVKYVQGASLLSILRKNYTNTSNNGTNTAPSFIGFGDPIYSVPRAGAGETSATKTPRHQEVSMSKHEGTRDNTKNMSVGTGHGPVLENTQSDTLDKNLSSVPSVSSVATTSPQAVDDEIKEIHHHRFSRAGGSLNPLPNSGPEILSIAHLFANESCKTTIYLQEQASEENAKAPFMKDFSFIHFSCHGLLNDDFQSLVLSQLPAEKSQEDGFFTLNEIMNCDYNAQLVVLSACDTGSGKMNKGEGVTGLTRAFMYAGSPAVVASLWKVDDEATKDLMVLFYTNLLEKKLDKVEALRQAKLELLKNPEFASPFYWSAFVLYGE